MPSILSVGTVIPPYTISWEASRDFVKGLFKFEYDKIERLLTVFENGQIETRNIVVPLDWFAKEHSLQEKNDLYIELAQAYGAKSVDACLRDHSFLKRDISYEEIEAIFFISSSGIATPSIEARIMNVLPFSPYTKRIPIWGLGCAGGAAGLSRAYEYCLAFPKAKVLVLSLEFCSLTFQKDDLSKSNVIGTSLFSDGVACALIVGDDVAQEKQAVKSYMPRVVGTQSTLMPHSEDVMGWDVRDNGLYVVFSRDIPQIISGWIKPNVDVFLQKHSLSLDDIVHFIAHPGGRKVLEAYETALGLSKLKTAEARDVLKRHGNMSSATVLHVLKQFLNKEAQAGEVGLIMALGPGFSSEMLLLEWNKF